MASFGRRLNMVAECVKLAVGSPSEMTRYHPDPARFRPIPRRKARAGSRFLKPLNASPTTASKDFVGFIGPATISLRR
jgi:hypothetical protein